MRVAFVVAAGLDAKTGGTIYDKKMAEGLRRLGWRVEVHALDGLASLPDGSLAVIDGLAYASGADLVEYHAARLRLVALVHLPLGYEVGLDADEAARRAAVERRVLAAVKRVIVTGRTTIKWLEGLGVDPCRMTVVEPGTPARGSTDSVPAARDAQGPVRLLSVGALTPGKGHELLIRALGQAPSSTWTLRCAGSLTRHGDTVERVRRLIGEYGLGQQIALLGELDDDALAGEYGRADVFVLATLRETYGMAVADAIAYGLPVVSTETGAIAEIADGGGLIVPPGDETALRDALTRAVIDPVCRDDLAAAARRARGRLPTWAMAARQMADVLETVAHE